MAQARLAKTTLTFDSAADDDWPSPSLVTQNLIFWTSAAILILYISGHFP